MRRDLQMMMYPGTCFAITLSVIMEDTMDKSKQPLFERTCMRTCNAASTSADAMLSDMTVIRRWLCWPETSLISSDSTAFNAAPEQSQ